MPVAVVCPACKAKLKAPDNLIGKTVKCPSCTKAILVKAAAAAVPAPAAAPASIAKKPVKRPAPPVLEEEEEPIEDVMDAEEEEIEARPKKKKRKNGDSTDSERSTASFIHFGTLINMIFAPLGYLVPIILWVTKRKESAFIDHHGKTWLNFQINMFALMLGSFLLLGGLALVGGFLSWWIAVIFIVLLWLLLLALGIYTLVMYIVAGMKAKQGEWFEYRVLFKVLK